MNVVQSQAVCSVMGWQCLAHIRRYAYYYINTLERYTLIEFALFRFLACAFPFAFARSEAVLAAIHRVLRLQGLAMESSFDGLSHIPRIGVQNQVHVIQHQVPEVAFATLLDCRLLDKQQ